MKVQHLNNEELELKWTNAHFDILTNTRSQLKQQLEDTKQQLVRDT